MTEPRLIVDTDPGHDDAIALILAHQLADVIGVTTVAGNTILEHTTRNALRICELLGVTAPVHAGAAAPINSKPAFAREVHGNDGLSGISLPEPRHDVASENAVEFLLDAVEPDIWVVAIGPLTNIAHAILRDRTWTDRIAGLSVMGGSAHGGNVTATSEFNIYFDPEAAETVFNASAKVRLCGLNLTHQVQISNVELQNIKRSSLSTPLSQFAVENFEKLITNLFRLTGTHEVAMHDPCAVLAVTHPELFGFERRNVKVELHGTLTRGMTVVDERSGNRGGDANVEVGYDVDANAVKRVIFNTIFAT